MSAAPWVLMTQQPFGSAADRPRRKPSRERNRAFVQEVKARTFCAHCGAQPIEWHNPEHVELNRQHYRISQMVNRGRSLADIQAEMDRCTPLCRRCHMAEDGRLSAFTEQATNPREIQEPKPCKECGHPYKPLRRGLCERCYDTRRRRDSGIEPLGMATVCRKGHPMVDGNILLEGVKTRRCKTCRRQYEREHRS